MKILGTKNDWRNEFGELNKIQQFFFFSYVSKFYVEFIEFCYHKCVMISSSFQMFVWNDSYVASTLNVVVFFYQYSFLH